MNSTKGKCENILKENKVDYFRLFWNRIGETSLHCEKSSRTFYTVKKVTV